MACVLIHDQEKDESILVFSTAMRICQYLAPCKTWYCSMKSVNRKGFSRDDFLFLLDSCSSSCFSNFEEKRADNLSAQGRRNRPRVKSPFHAFVVGQDRSDAAFDIFYPALPTTQSSHAAMAMKFSGAKVTVADTPKTGRGGTGRPHQRQAVRRGFLACRGGV